MGTSVTGTDGCAAQALGEGGEEPGPVVGELGAQVGLVGDGRVQGEHEGEREGRVVVALGHGEPDDAGDHGVEVGTVLALAQRHGQRVHALSGELEADQGLAGRVDLEGGGAGAVAVGRQVRQRQGPDGALWPPEALGSLRLEEADAPAGRDVGVQAEQQVGVRRRVPDREPQLEGRAGAARRHEGRLVDHAEPGSTVAPRAGAGPRRRLGGRRRSARTQAHRDEEGGGRDEEHDDRCRGPPGPVSATGHDVPGVVGAGTRSSASTTRPFASRRKPTRS